MDRAWSHYWFRTMWRAESASFEDVVDDEISGRERPAGGEYIAIGRYAEQISHLHLYYPPEQHLVLLFDDLVKEPAETFRRLCRHLGVSDDALPPIVGEQINTTYDVRSFRLAQVLSRLAKRRDVIGKVAARGVRLNAVVFEQPPMPEHVRRSLIETFAPLNAELASLIGRDLSDWSR